MKVLSVGLLVSDFHASRYVHELTAWSTQRRNLRISHVVACLSDRDAAGRLGQAFGFSTNLSGFLSRSLIGLQTRIELSRLKRIPLHRDVDQRFDLRHVVPDSLEVHLVASSRDCYRFSDQDVQRIKSLNCDVLVWCGEGPLEGDIVKAARHGVICYQYGYARSSRDAPAAFWEWYHRRPKTGFAIRRLAQSGEGEVLVRGFYRTQPRYLLNQASLHKKANHHLQDLLGSLAANGGLPEPELAFDSAPNLDGFPSPLQALASLARFVYGYGRSKLLDVMKVRDAWGMSFVHSGWKNANLRESIAVRNPAGRSWNTPFVYARDNRSYCFVEDDVYATLPRKGRILVLELAGETAVEVGVCLEEPFHLAFPFLFEYRGGLYMCPESGGSGQIRLYRCTDFPLGWELCNVLMNGLMAVNTMLFERNGKWWMLTNVDRSGTDDCCSELYLFSADSPLDVQWTPHPQNPVRIDSDGGRNAGLILEGGQAYRLGQRHGYEQYGQGVIVFEIRELTESRYLEQAVGEIDASFRKGLRGIHHFASDGATTVVDHVVRARGH